MHLTYYKILFKGMGQLITCRICGREFESEEELKKHEPRCAFSRQQYSLRNEDVENYK